jgi:hypothetical protein
VTGGVPVPAILMHSLLISIYRADNDLKPFITGALRRRVSSDDRRLRVVAFTKSGKDLMVPIFRKYSAQIVRMFADATPTSSKHSKGSAKAGKRAERLPKREAPGRCIEAGDRGSLATYTGAF